MKKKRWIYLLLPIVTLILEALPYGAVLNFIRPAEDGTKGNFRELYSYFDLTPFGWANFAPFITAIITCIVFLLLLAYCFTGKTQMYHIDNRPDCQSPGDSFHSSNCKVSSQI